MRGIPLTLALAVAATLPARAQDAVPTQAPPPPPTQTCKPAAPIAGQWWQDYAVTAANGQDTYTGKAIDCTSFALSVPTGTPVCRALGTACLATTMTPLSFMARFAAPEQQALALAAQSNATVLLWMLKMSAAQEVDLSDPQTQAGVQALVSAGLLTADRAAQVLTP